MKKIKLFLVFVGVLLFNISYSQDILGNVATEGTLKLKIWNDCNMQVYRYTSGIWVEQWYDAAGFYQGHKSYKLVINGTDYQQSGSSYFGAGTNYASVVNNKIDNNNHTQTCTITGKATCVQTIYYAPNSNTVNYTYTITNTSAVSLSNLRFISAGDTYLAGDDNGYGYWDGSTNTIGVTNTISGTLVNLYMQSTGAEVPFNHESDTYSNIESNVGSKALSGFVDVTKVDNGMGLEWRKASLAAGATWTINVCETFSDKLVSNLIVTAPTGTTISAGETKNITYTVKNNSGSTQSGITLAELVDLSASGWTGTIVSPTGTISIAAGVTQNVTVSVYCPVSATVGTVAQAKLTATYSSSNANDIAYLTVVTPTCRGTLSSAVGTDAQTICSGLPITNITYSTLVATGITSSGLPTGINANWASNVVTISGTVDPAATGSYPYTITLTGGTCSGQTVTGTFTVNLSSTASAGGALAAICQSSTSAAMAGSVGGGATGGTWSGGAGVWSNATNVATATYTAGAAETGSITLTLTTSGGSCGTTTATKSITVSGNIPTSNAGLGTTICSVSDFTASATATLGTILWSSSGTGTFTDATIEDAIYHPSVADTIAGNVTLTMTVTGNSGVCTSVIATSTVLVSINTIDAPNANAGTDAIICSVSNYTASTSTSTAGNLTWSGGTGSFSSTSALHPVYTPSVGDIGVGHVTLTLTATGTANECLAQTTSDAVLVTFNTADAPNANAGTDAIICSVSNYTASTSSSTAGNLTWSGGTGSFSSTSALHPVYTPSVGDIGVGHVTLTLTATGTANECLAQTTSDAVLVTFNTADAPNANAGLGSTICSVSTFTPSATSTAGTILWSTAGTGSFSSTSILNPVYTPSAADILAGSVILTLRSTGTVNACTSQFTTSQVTVLINSADAPTANAGLDDNMCSVGSYTLSGTSSKGTALWSGGTGVFTPNNTTLNAVYTPSAAEKLAGVANLTLTVTGNVAGTCSSSTINDAIIITINNSGTITLLPPSLSKDRDTCFAMPITDIRYFIGGTATGATVTGLPTGISATYTAGILKISGSSSVSGIFPYTVNTTGNCPAIPETGTITIRSEITSPLVSPDVTNCQEVIGTDMTATASSGGTLVWASDNSFSTILGQGATLTPSSSLGTTSYYVREVLNGCYSSSSVINVTVQYCDVETPTAFTPDGDDVNDTWVLKHIDETYPNNIVTIYDRWGLKIYESPKGQYESHKWDGKFNGKALPVDSYFYIIDYNDSKKPVKNGAVTIILQNK